MPAVPPELFNQINELKEEFQRAAGIYPWLSLYIPQINRDDAPFLGEATATIYASSSDTFGVDSPKDLGRRAAVDHVNQLTWRTERLLAKVLDFDTGIPPDIQEEIRDWEQTKMGYGWIRWLWHATVTHTTWLFRNYAQVAATALLELKECCRSSGRERDLFEARLRFDATTHTVYLDEKPHPVHDPRTFAFYRMLADQKGQPISRREMRSKNKQFRGDKTASRLREQLPRALKKTVQSSNKGYWLHLPPKK